MQAFVLTLLWLLVVTPKGSKSQIGDQGHGGQSSSQCSLDSVSVQEKFNKLFKYATASEDCLGFFSVAEVAFRKGSKGSCPTPQSLKACADTLTDAMVEALPKCQFGLTPQICHHMAVNAASSVDNALEHKQYRRYVKFCTYEGEDLWQRAFENGYMDWCRGSTNAPDSLDKANNGAATQSGPSFQSPSDSKTAVLVCVIVVVVAVATAVLIVQVAKAKIMQPKCRGVEDTLTCSNHGQVYQLLPRGEAAA